MRERAHRSGRKYAAIPNEAMRDNRMSIEARGLLALLMTYSDDWVFRRDHLMEVSGMGKDRFTRVMGELVAAGYVERTSVQDEAGKMTGRSWIIKDEPETEVREIRTTDTEVRENRCPGKPLSGKPAPIRKPIYKKTKEQEEQTASDLFSAKTKQEKPDKTDELFDRFWKEYPKKVGKPAARKNFIKAIKKTDPEKIIEGAKRYAAWLKSGGPNDFRPIAKHPQGWLTDERWNDEEIRQPDRPQTYAQKVLAAARTGRLA